MLDIGFSVAICKKEGNVKRFRVLLAKEIAVSIVVCGHVFGFGCFMHAGTFIKGAFNQRISVYT